MITGAQMTRISSAMSSRTPCIALASRRRRLKKRIKDTQHKRRQRANKKKEPTNKNNQKQNIM